MAFCVSTNRLEYTFYLRWFFHEKHVLKWDYTLRWHVPEYRIDVCHVKSHPNQSVSTSGVRSRERNWWKFKLIRFLAPNLLQIDWKSWDDVKAGSCDMLKIRLIRSENIIARLCLTLELVTGLKVKWADPTDVFMCCAIYLNNNCGGFRGGRKRNC